LERRNSNSETFHFGLQSESRIPLWIIRISFVIIQMSSGHNRLTGHLRHWKRENPRSGANGRTLWLFADRISFVALMPPINPVEAVKYFKLAANQNDAAAQNNCASSLQQGIGV
jgi:hypothetical protein